MLSQTGGARLERQGRFWSTGETAGIEEGLFVGCRDAAQGCVTMGKSPETTNDIGVEFCPFQCLDIVVCAKEPEATLLVHRIFGVLEWNVEELPLHRGNPLIEPAADGPIGDRAGECIGGESAGAVTKHVPRELVEYDHKRQRALGRVLPMRQAPGDGCFVGGQKATRDLGVEVAILCVPFVRPGSAPESQHLSGLCNGAVCCSVSHKRTWPARMRS